MSAVGTLTVVVGSDELAPHGRHDPRRAASRAWAAAGSGRALPVAAVVVAVAAAPAAAHAPRPAPSGEPLWREYPLTVARHTPPPRAAAPAAVHPTAAGEPAPVRARDRPSPASGPTLAALLAVAVAALVVAVRAAAIFLLRTFTYRVADASRAAPTVVPGRRRSSRIRTGHSRRIAATAASLTSELRGRVPRPGARAVHGGILAARTRVGGARARRPLPSWLPRPTVALSRAGTLRLVLYAALIALAAVLGGLAADLTTS